MKPSKVGVALPLTPHLDAVVAEASRFAARFGASLTLIHAGTSEAESGAYIEAAAQRLGIPHEQKIIWNQTDPAISVMTAAANAGIDLLVVSAFEGPALGKRRFLGTVAQDLARGAQCSLLLLAHPRVQEHRFAHIVAMTDFSDSSKNACELALSVADADRADSFHVVSIHTIFMEARARLGTAADKVGRTYQEEEQLMDDFLASLPECNVPLEGRVLRGTTGFVACDFAESVDADLLVLPGHHRMNGRIPPVVDWALRVLPCDVWLVHHGPVWTDEPTHT